MGKEMISLVNTKELKEIATIFFILIDIVAFLATHQSAFRGKIDSLESEDEGRNELFLSLLNHTVEKDQR